MIANKLSGKIDLVVSSESEEVGNFAADEFSSSDVMPLRMNTETEKVVDGTDASSDGSL